MFWLQEVQRNEPPPSPNNNRLHMLCPSHARLSDRKSHPSSKSRWFRQMSPFGTYWRKNNCDFLEDEVHKYTVSLQSRHHPARGRAHTHTHARVPIFNLARSRLLRCCRVWTVRSSTAFPSHLNSCCISCTGYFPPVTESCSYPLRI